jgi:hypothetical protein
MGASARSTIATASTPTALCWFSRFGAPRGVEGGDDVSLRYREIDGRRLVRQLQIGEPPPVLYERRRGEERLSKPEQPLIGMLLKLSQHLRHRGEDRPPLGDHPRSVDSHTDKEDHDLVA